MTALDSALAWAKNEATTSNYAVIGISIIVNDGKVARIEKTVTEKELVDDVH